MDNLPQPPFTAEDRLRHALARVHILQDQLRTARLELRDAVDAATQSGRAAA